MLGYGFVSIIDHLWLFFQPMYLTYEGAQVKKSQSISLNDSIKIES